MTKVEAVRVARDFYYQHRRRCDYRAGNCEWVCRELVKRLPGAMIFVFDVACNCKLCQEEETSEVRHRIVFWRRWFFDLTRRQFGDAPIFATPIAALIGETGDPKSFYPNWLGEP